MSIVLGILKLKEGVIKIKHVFISHPYCGKPIYNKKRVDRICRQIIRRNDDILPISPLHLFGFLESDKNYREEILHVCYELIKFCDEVWFYYYDAPAEFAISRLSEGQKKELNEAIYQGKLIKFIEFNE